MGIRKWEDFIQKMIEESKLETKEPSKIRVLTEWRRTLTKSPHLLQPFQIDEIVREVRSRLTTASQQSNNGYSQAKSA